MSATSAPFGLRPAFHPSGLDRAQALANGITSAYNTDIFKGQPVRYNTTAIGGTLGTICPATTSGAWVGSFAGVEWTDTTGRARVSNYWPANTAYTAGSCVAYFYNNQNIVYESPQALSGYGARSRISICALLPAPTKVVDSVHCDKPVVVEPAVVLLKSAMSPTEV